MTLPKVPAFRAFEHQVFEQVREAGTVLRLGAHADLVDDAEAHHRRAVVFADDDGQAVVQRLHRDRQVETVRIAGEGGGREGQPDQDGQELGSTQRGQECRPDAVNGTHSLAGPDDDQAGHTSFPTPLVTLPPLPATGSAPYSRID
jgi:hypothetical protein